MTDRLAEIKGRHERFVSAVRDSCPELLTNSMTADMAWLIAEVERLRTDASQNRDKLLRVLAKGIDDMGTQIPDYGPGEDRWYEILRSIAAETE